MRWRSAKVLGVGIGVLVGGIGLLFLLGLWISAKRDVAWWEAMQTGDLERWRYWDRAYIGWVYGFLIGLMGLSLGVGFYWLSRIGDGLAGLEMWVTSFLQGRPPGIEPASGNHLAETQAVQQGLLQTEHLLRRLEALAEGQATPSPQDEGLAPVYKSALENLQRQMLMIQTQQRQAAAWQKGAQVLLNLSYTAPQKGAYLQKAVSWLTEQAGAFMGGFYLLEGKALQRVAGYAYPAGVPTTFQVGEGWIGSVALSGEALWLYPVSGKGTPFGEAEPVALGLLPVLAGHTLLGVWEMAAFSPWSEEEKTLIEAWLFFFGLGLDYLIQKEGLQLQAEALKAERLHQHQLLQEKDELQRQLEQAVSERAHMERRLTERDKRLEQLSMQLSERVESEQLMLSNLREVVVLFEASGRARYVSPSAEKLLGYKPQELEAFFKPVLREDAEKVAQFFHQVLDSTQTPLSLSFRYRHRSGETLWLEMQALNYLHHPAVAAIVGIIQDITSQIEYERQYRTRLKFQSLVEHAPDLIWRLDRDGQFLYVNPVIERYTSYTPSHYIRNSIYSVGFSMDEVRFWRAFLDRIFDSLEMQAEEIRFPSVYGDRRMSVRGIPELGPEGAVETVVVLLQDITELRQVQERLREKNSELENLTILLRKQKHELEEKNRDIMESITYARRIQEGILSGEEIISSYFREGFVLHLLRDVVGGDFYWIREVDGRIYVAVVDCTGHGVPGAFMAFLGHTLLEGAIRDRRLADPARTLQDMEQRLREMLGAGETQDGMDVALCVFEPERRVFHFAGAHRPLWYYHSGRWQLISGSPAGLGGASWLEPHKVFTTHSFAYEKGDLIYLYTDGYLDQFGEATKRRLGHRRFRDLIVEYAALPMADQKELLAHFLRAYQGAISQTDDITVLGIRL